jgi:hypothetical protein
MARFFHSMLTFFDAARILEKSNTMCATFKSANDPGQTPECHAGTRTALIVQIMDSLSTPDGPRICWLTGMMGMGKSAVARSIAEKLSEQSRLAASFFFSRRAGCVKYLFPNIAIQLTSSIPELEGSIMAALRDPFILNTVFATSFNN